MPRDNDIPSRGLHNRVAQLDVDLEVHFVFAFHIGDYFTDPQ